MPHPVELEPSAESFRLRYLRILRSIQERAPCVQLHLASLTQSIEAVLESWCPSELLCKPQAFTADTPDGVLCVQQLSTPLGTVSKARIRESDVLAVEVIASSKHND